MFFKLKFSEGLSTIEAERKIYGDNTHFILNCEELLTFKDEYSIYWAINRGLLSLMGFNGFEVLKNE